MADGRVLKAAVVGAGVFGGYHAEKYAALPEAELVAVVDADPARAEAVAAKHGARAFTDVAELPPEVEVASVATPTVAHHPVGRALIARGVHVLIEKPVADTVERGLDLAEAAEARGLVLQVGHIERFSAAYEALSETVRRPLFIECNRISPFTGRSADVNVVLDLMIHDIDLITALVGAPVESIEAVGAPVLTDHEDIANARLRFENGCVANITASRVSFKTERKLRIFQPDKYTVADLHERKIFHVRRLPPEPGKTDRALDAAETSFPKADNLMNEIRLFLAAVAGGARPRVSGRDGVEALRIALAIGDSQTAHRDRVAALIAAEEG